MTTVKITLMTKINGNAIYLCKDFIIIFYWSAYLKWSSVRSFVLTEV